MDRELFKREVVMVHQFNVICNVEVTVRADGESRESAFESAKNTVAEMDPRLVSISFTSPDGNLVIGAKIAGVPEQEDTMKPEDITGLENGEDPE